jgi:hypothetical protein
MVKPAGFTGCSERPSGFPCMSILIRLEAVISSIVGVDEEMVFRPGNAGRKMGKNQVVPPVKCDQAIRRGQVSADLPFVRRHVRAGIDRR